MSEYERHERTPEQPNWVIEDCIFTKYRRDGERIQVLNTEELASISSLSGIFETSAYDVAKFMSTHEDCYFVVDSRSIIYEGFMAAAYYDNDRRGKDPTLFICGWSDLPDSDRQLYEADIRDAVNNRDEV